MNPNSGETPNPLNPEPDAPTNSTPEPLDANPSEPVQQMHGGSLDGMVGNSRPTKEPIQNNVEEVVVTESETISAPAEPIDPMNRPMVQVVEPDATVAAKPKKKRTGLIVAILACLLIAVGCGVAAVLLVLNGKNTDAVRLAMNRLMSGEAPTNVMISGTIDMQIGDPDSPFSQVNVDLNTKLVANPAQNSTSATLKFIPQNSTNELSLGVSELSSANGDVYLKLDGVSEFINGMMNANLPDDGEVIEGEMIESEMECEDPTNCMSGNIVEETPDSSIIGAFAGIFETIEGEWLKLSVDEAEGVADGMSFDGPLSCVVDLTNQINTSSSSAIELYDKYPFVTSTTEKLAVASRKNPIYKLGIDSEKLTKYIDEIQNTELLNSLYSCLGAENNVNISADDVTEMVAKLPEIYVEIDGNHDFTRLYVKAEFKDECDEECQENGEVSGYTNTLLVDLDLSYPSSISIIEPSEYISLTDLMQQMWQEPEPDSELDF